MRVSKEFKDNVLEYFTTVMIPYIMKSPDVHRFRLFEVDNATVLEGASHETKENDDTLPYLSLVEFATEDYPWDVILEMADTDEWKRWVGDPKMMVCLNRVWCSGYSDKGTDMAGRPLLGQQIVLGKAPRRHYPAIHQQLRCSLGRRLSFKYITTALSSEPHSGAIP